MLLHFEKDVFLLNHTLNTSAQVAVVALIVTGFVRICSSGSQMGATGVTKGGNLFQGGNAIHE